MIVMVGENDLNFELGELQRGYEQQRTGFGNSRRQVHSTYERARDEARCAVEALVQDRNYGETTGGKEWLRSFVTRELREVRGSMRLPWQDKQIQLTPEEVAFLSESYFVDECARKMVESGVKTEQELISNSTLRAVALTQQLIHNVPSFQPPITRLEDLHKLVDEVSLNFYKYVKNKPVVLLPPNTQNIVVKPFGTLMYRNKTNRTPLQNGTLLYFESGETHGHLALPARVDMGTEIGNEYDVFNVGLPADEALRIFPSLRNALPDQYRPTVVPVPYIMKRIG